MTYIEYEDSEGYWLIVVGMTMLQADIVTTNNPQFVWSWKDFGNQQYPAFLCQTTEEREVFGKHLSRILR